MKRIKSIVLYSPLAASPGVLCTSYANKLDLPPIDYYRSGLYWKTEVHVIGYIDDMHKHLRDATFRHTFIWGKARGDTLVSSGISADDMGVLYGDIKLQNFDEDHIGGIDKFGDIFRRLTNINLSIARVMDATCTDDTKKGYYLGQAYGLRALYYFDPYCTYGGAPLRLSADVVEGVTSPNKLYMARVTPREVMDQTKKDLNKSIEYFGDNNSLDPNNRGNREGYWSKAATECLMGKVYLWISKVSTGDDSANESNLGTARTHLQDVLNSYGLKMLDDFSSVFDAKNRKGSSEIIFTVRRAEGEATNNNNLFICTMATGSIKDNYLVNGEEFLDVLDIANTGSQQLGYKHEIYNNFDVTDTQHGATFTVSHGKNVETNELTLRGTHVRKNIDYVNAQGSRIYCGGYIIYCLPLVYLILAKVENMQGGSVTQYIDIVRKRAYGTNWNETMYGYKGSDYTTNGLVILHKEDEELIQGEQRWQDIRRMILTRGGKYLVFCKEENIGIDTPTLDETTEAYEVLQPVDKTLLDNGPLIYQTSGYATYKKQG